MAARRSGLPLIKYLRVQVDALPHNYQTPLRLFQNVLLRRFSTEEVRGCFLDKSEVTDRVVSCVKNFQKVDPSKVTPNAHFKDDLGLDSLDSVEIVMALEEEFGFEIPDNEADKIESIKLAVDFIASHPQAK
ncbi:acyl carrier protein 2, mitochondrial [Gastrolobium bilobum]|uniref:acyl carrier protein 2, mitochondrial n=1 Tax=Gastrolobium bilobum TaxID=150636 RepID=UPI002AAFCD8B|nr:acyl carrier protein 2, mitochondrial [Gastrolobium bilobum]